MRYRCKTCGTIFDSDSKPLSCCACGSDDLHRIKSKSREINNEPMIDQSKERESNGPFVVKKKTPLKVRAHILSGGSRTRYSTAARTSTYKLPKGFSKKDTSFLLTILRNKEFNFWVNVFVRLALVTAIVLLILTGATILNSSWGIECWGKGGLFGKFLKTILIVILGIGYLRYKFKE